MADENTAAESGFFNDATTALPPSVFRYRAIKC
jgi:hypothetical protein